MPIQLREEYLDFYKGEEAITLLHLSDIHIWCSNKKLERLKALILKANPDLLIFTGDYFDIPRGARLFRDFLCELALKYTIVFIRGNHDFLYGSRIADLLLNIPNCYCVESSVYTFISKKGYVYHITSWDQRHCLQKRKGERNIVLIHNPEKLKKKEMAGIDLVLAGHLHGGQFILFKTPGNAHFPGSMLYKYCTDRTLVHNTIIIISKGLGDTFPLRLNCEKEVVKIQIT
jgi:predicted MPP superfamily phosphohydrolase